jgi:hypothetical protein
MSSTVESSMPAITPEMRAAALENPNSWLYVIDPALDPDAEVPPWAVVGAYPVNELGQIEDNFRPNGDYRPTVPAAPDLDELLDRVRSGEVEQKALLPAVLAARLLVYAAGPDDTTVTGFPSRRFGAVMVPACTSPERVPPAWPGWREIDGHDLVTLLDGHSLVLNPHGPVTAMIPASHLLSALPG